MESEEAVVLLWLNTEGFDEDSSGISAFSFVFFCVAVCCFCFMRLIFDWTVSMAVVYLSTACLTSSCFAVICSEIVSTSFSVVRIWCSVVLLKKIRAMMHRSPVRNRRMLIMLGFFIYYSVLS